MVRIASDHGRNPSSPPISGAAVTLVLLAVLPVLAWLAPPLTADDGRAPAADQRDQALQPRRPADFDPRQFEGGPVPLTVESLGLAMYRPAESDVRLERQPGHVAVHLRDIAPIPAWTMSIQHLIVHEPTTAREQLQSHIQQIQEHGEEIAVVTNQPLELGEITGHLAMVRYAPERGDPYINGWLMLPVGEQMFLVCSFLTTAEDFPSIEPMLIACFSTINLRTVDQLAEQRLSRLGAGQLFLDSVNPEKLKGLVGRQLWMRIYKPEEDGRGHAETEIGYALLEIIEARRGLLNPERPEEHYSSEEKRKGMLVRIQGRVIGDLERNLFYDSLALYWMAWDQSEEAWSVRGTQRQGEAERTETETGIRRAPAPTSPIPTIKVIRTRSADYGREPSEWSVPDVYLSQALGTVLGLLLPTEERRARELAFYHYVHAHGAPTLTQRIDRWEPQEDHADRWMLSTRLTPDSQPVRTVYRSDGTLVRRVHPDGSIAEPIQFEELRRLWQRKGLPLSDVRPRR